MNARNRLAVLGIFMAANACSATPDDVAAVSGVAESLRPLTVEESLADFDQMVAAFRADYAPLARKEQRYHFSFDQHVEDSHKAIEHASSADERETVFARFLARFEDVHVSLQDDLSTEEPPVLALPLAVMPLGHGYAVYWVNSQQTMEIARGDELLAMDGVPVADIIERFSPLIGRPNPLAQRHLAARQLTNRAGIFASDVAAGDTTTLQLRDAAGATREVSLTWQAQPSVLADAPQAPAAGSGSPTLAYGFDDAAAIRAELRSYGASKPFFYTKAVTTQFEMHAIFPSDRALQDFGVTLAATTEISYFAARYSYGGQRILLLRIPDFRTSSNADIAQRLNYLRALLSEQQPLNDALVLDVTHNPGGVGMLTQGLVSMFASEQINAAMTELHVDRAQLANYLEAAAALRAMPEATETALNEASQLEAVARRLDELYTAGQPLSEPVRFTDTPSKLDPDRVRWVKPCIVLIDELSTSAADMLPLLMQANHLAPIFGSRSAGAGGNTEIVTTLPNSARKLYLTRGLFTVFDPTGEYPDDRFIEDQGVTPDIEYNHTLADFRAGYVGYVEAFSKALLASTKP